MCFQPRQAIQVNIDRKPQVFHEGAGLLESVSKKAEPRDLSAESAGQADRSCFTET
jgi:hypothetical protein